MNNNHHRQAFGMFAPGNPGGPGRPRKPRPTIEGLDLPSEQKVKRLLDKLYAVAMGGHVPAAKLWLTYTVGEFDPDHQVVTQRLAALERKLEALRDPGPVGAWPYAN